MEQDSKFKRSDQNKPAPIEVKSVTDGAIDRLIDLRYNPSRDKIREMTHVDRMQGKLLPMIDTMNSMRKYCIEIAVYRQDPEEYEHVYNRKRPIPPDVIDELMYRMAQWSKSIEGRNMKTADDIVLAQAETGSGDERDSVDLWGRD